MFQIILSSCFQGIGFFLFEAAQDATKPELRDVDE